MFCPKCGKELKDTAIFCSGCGEKIVKNDSVAEDDSVSDYSDLIDAAELTDSVESEDFGIPTGNVITGTLPAQDDAPSSPVSETPVPEASVSETSVPEAPVSETTAQEGVAAATSTLPRISDGVQGSVVKPDGKMSLKKKLILGGAGVAAVAVVGVGVAGFTFAKADFAHTFMGDQKYAASLMGKQFEQVADNPILSAGMASVSVSSGETDSSDILTSALSQLKSSIPEKGAQIEISLDADLSDEMLEDFAYDLDCDIDQVKKIIEAVKELKLSAGVQFSETGIAATASGHEGSKELMKVNAFYDADTEAYYISVPGVSDECLMLADDEAIIDMEALNEMDKSNSAKEMITDVISKYKDCLDDAEVTFDRGELSIGNVEFSGRVSSVVFEDDALADMISNVSEEFLDSEYADSLGDVSALQDLFDDMASSIEECDGAKLTIDNFVNSNNTVAGMRFEIEVKQYGEKNKAEIAYLNTKDGFAFSVGEGGKDIIEFSQEKENKTDGKFTGKISDGYQNGKITVDYKQMSHKKMLGKDVILGDYTLRCSGDMFESMDMSFDKLMLKIEDDGGKLSYTIGVKDDSDSVNLKLALSEGIPETIDAETMKISTAYDALGEADKDKVNDFYARLIEYLANQTKDSEFFTSVPVYDGTLADEIEATAQRARREMELSQNYADYNGNTVFEAYQEAENIYYAVDDINFNIGSSAAKVKLYYDKDGKLSILDNAGMSALENDIIGKLGDFGYKSTYVEIVVWPGRGPLCGVNVVKTDDKSNLPDNLPDAYSFLDGEYKWGSDEDINFVGSFVVRTCPILENGEGGDTKAADEKLASDVKAYNADAEKAYNAMNEFTGLTSTEGETGYIDFYFDDGEWDYYTYGGRMNGSSTDAAEYLTEKLGKLNAKHVCFYYEGSKLVGTTAYDGYYYSSFAVEDFKRKNTEMWSYMDGIVNGNVVGTYPSLSKMTTLPQEYLDAMVGTWVVGNYDTLTLSADDLKNITFSLNRSGGSLNYIYVKTTDKGYFYFYPNNGDPYISDGWYTYTKI